MTPCHHPHPPNPTSTTRTEYLCVVSRLLCNCSIISFAIFWGKQQLSWFHMTPCDITWHHMTSHDVMWCHVMSHDVTWYHMLFCFAKKGSKDNVKPRWQSTITMILILLSFIDIEQLQRHPQTKFNSYPQLLYISAFAYSKLLVSQMQAFRHS